MGDAADVAGPASLGTVASEAEGAGAAALEEGVSGTANATGVSDRPAAALGAREFRRVTTPAAMRSPAASAIPDQRNPRDGGVTDGPKAG